MFCADSEVHHDSWNLCFGVKVWGHPDDFQISCSLSGLCSTLQRLTQVIIRVGAGWHQNQNQQYFNNPFGWAFREIKGNVKPGGSGVWAPLILPPCCPYFCLIRCQLKLKIRPKPLNSRCKYQWRETNNRGMFLFPSVVCVQSTVVPLSWRSQQVTAIGVAAVNKWTLNPDWAQCVCGWEWTLTLTCEPSNDFTKLSVNTQTPSQTVGLYKIEALSSADGAAV